MKGSESRKSRVVSWILATLVLEQITIVRWIFLVCETLFLEQITIIRGAFRVKKLSGPDLIMHVRGGGSPSRYFLS